MPGEFNGFFIIKQIEKPLLNKKKIIKKPPSRCAVMRKGHLRQLLALAMTFESEFQIHFSEK